MGMTVDRCAVLTADTVGMVGLRRRKRSQHRLLFSKADGEVCTLSRADGAVRVHIISAA